MTGAALSRPAVPERLIRLYADALAEVGLALVSTTVAPTTGADRACRPFEDPRLPGRLDRAGRQWWACDPYPHWFRWSDGALIVRPEFGDAIGWADEPAPVGDPPCSPSCRRFFWSDYCECQGWCA